MRCVSSFDFILTEDNSHHPPHTSVLLFPTLWLCLLIRTSQICSGEQDGAMSRLHLLGCVAHRHQTDVVTVAKTEHKNDDRRPRWRHLNISPYSLCGGDLDAPLRLDVRDYSSSKKHLLIGKYITSLRELLSCASHEERTYQLLSADKNDYKCKLEVKIMCDKRG